MYAGTPATSVTLWSVNLLSAKVLSTELYRHLKANLEKGEAQKLAHALQHDQPQNGPCRLQRTVSLGTVCRVWGWAVMMIER